MCVYGGQWAGVLWWCPSYSYRAGCKKEKRSQGVDGVGVRGGKSAIHKSHKPIHPEDPRVQCIRVKSRSKDGVLRWMYRVSMWEEQRRITS